MFEVCVHARVYFYAARFNWSTLVLSRMKLRMSKHKSQNMLQLCPHILISLEEIFVFSKSIIAELYFSSKVHCSINFHFRTVYCSGRASLN